MDYQGHELLYNAAAHFAATEKYESGIIDAINSDFNAICWALAEMSAQAEAMNRYMQRDAREPLNELALRVSMRPVEVVDAKRAILEAVMKGISAKDDPNAEIDEVLLELQKKTDND